MLRSFKTETVAQRASGSEGNPRSGIKLFVQAYGQVLSRRGPEKQACLSAWARCSHGLPSEAPSLEHSRRRRHEALFLAFISAWTFYFKVLSPLVSDPKSWRSILP